jgi:SulP family sulfate permease
MLIETHDMIKPHANMSQPTLLLAQTFGDLTTPYKPQHPEDEDDASLTAPPPMEFYHTLAHYFEKRTFEAGATIWRQGDPCDFLIVLECDSGNDPAWYGGR